MVPGQRIVPGAESSGHLLFNKQKILKIDACRSGKTALEDALEIGGRELRTVPIYGPCADVAQLVRASDCGSEGRWFESTRLYHFSPTHIFLSSIT
jgi:hypothetical protein